MLAPVFMIGGALGALVGHVFPEVFPGFWAILGLASVVGGVLRSPLTGIVFTLELTHAWPALLPVVIASISGYAVSVLALDRSILTEKIARRGLHLTSDYTTDPLETFFVNDVVRPGSPPVPVVGTVTTEDTLRHAATSSPRPAAVRWVCRAVTARHSATYSSKTSWWPACTTSPRQPIAPGT